jgi:DNA-binding transcriptional ArsR family regulator
VLTYRSIGGRALEALGDPTRRAIFELLVGRPQPVRELADALPVSRPAVSQHLKVLKQSGLVIDRAEGTRRIYRVDPAGVAAMRQYLDQMWDSALGAFAAAVENQEPNTRKDKTDERAGRHRGGA